MKFTFKLLHIGFLGLTVSVQAQNEIFFNHYMFNPTYFNPAWVSAEKEGKLFAMHRSQWAGYNATVDPGRPPSTQLISLNVPSQLGRISGVGVTFINDRIADNSSMEVRLALGSSFQINPGIIHLGIAPSFSVRTIGSNLRPVDMNDEFIPDGMSQSKPNLHFGAMYISNKKMEVGLSFENIVSPNFDFGTGASNKVPVHYILYGAKTFTISRELEVKPSVLIRSDLTSYSYDIGGIFYYQGKLWVGLSYRRSESLDLLAGYSFLKDNKLSFGYSFNYVLVEQEAKQPTSHEILIKYNLPNIVLGGRKVVKTPRFSF